MADKIKRYWPVWGGVLIGLSMLGIFLTFITICPDSAIGKLFLGNKEKPITTENIKPDTNKKFYNPAINQPTTITIPKTETTTTNKSQNTNNNKTNNDSKQTSKGQITYEDFSSYVPQFNEQIRVCQSYIDEVNGLISEAEAAYNQELINIDNWYSSTMTGNCCIGECYSPCHSQADDDERQRQKDEAHAELRAFRISLGDIRVDYSVNLGMLQSILSDIQRRIRYANPQSDLDKYTCRVNL